MAARKDYASKRKKSSAASRSAPKQAPRQTAVDDNHRRKSPPPSRRRLPLARIMLTLALAGGLGYFLYTLTQVAPSASPQKSVEVKPQPVAKPRPEPVPAAPAPEDKARFEFYQMLPKSEVTTSDPGNYKSTPKTDRMEHSYLLQAGSFRNPEDADRMRAKLLLLGLPNVQTSKSVNDQGSTWYRVRVGPFESRSQLNKAYDKLVRLDIQPMQVRQ